MHDPCEKCRDRDICRKERTIDECKRKLAFRKYKEKCKEIAENTENIMAAARENAKKHGN